MVWIPLKDGNSGQVVKGIKLKSPHDGLTYIVGSSKRLGINRYLINLTNNTAVGISVTNHDIKRDGWSLIDRWHTPEEIANMYGRSKVDPDANLPRPQRESFWKMQSKPGTHNYKQKKKLMLDPWYQERFGKYFSTTVVD